MTRPTHQEFASLTPNNVVFKLVGPVLVKQEQAEAKSNVDKRLEFIREEMSVRLNFAAPSLIVPHRPLIANGLRVSYRTSNRDQRRKRWR